MHTTRRNKDYAVAPVSKEIMMDDSKITSCAQDASLTSILGIVQRKLDSLRSLSKFNLPNHRFGISLKNQNHQISNETFRKSIILISSLDIFHGVDLTYSWIIYKVLH